MAKVFTEESDHIIKLLEYNKKLQNGVKISVSNEIIISNIVKYVKKYPNDLNKIHHILVKYTHSLIKSFYIKLNIDLIFDYLAETYDNFMKFLIISYDRRYSFCIFDYLHYIIKYSNESLYPNIQIPYNILVNMKNNEVILKILKIFYNKLNLNVKIGNLYLLHRFALTLESKEQLFQLFNLYINTNYINVISNNDSNVLHYLCINSKISLSDKIDLVKYLMNYVNINLMNKKKYKPFDYYKMRHKLSINLWDSIIKQKEPTIEFNINLSNKFLVLSNNLLNKNYFFLFDYLLDFVINGQSI